MKQLNDYTFFELNAFESENLKRYRELLDMKLNINMARGKQSAEQLDLSEAFLDSVTTERGVKSENGEDCRNYGLLKGIPECRRLFGEMLDVDPENIIACGNSSLVLMYDYVSQCMTHGAGCTPWMMQHEPKFIALVPGYDRHFAIAEHFGLQMISVPMTPEGPDMELVEKLIKDSSVKGMFCTPKYSNPDGVTYSARTLERLASMRPAAPDFRIIWDNAYCVHDLYENGDEMPSILKLAEKYGNEDNFIEFASTSKITFPGSGVACIAASKKNIEAIAKRLTLQIISYDKLNQLRHCHVFKCLNDVTEHMKLHAEILRPKFETVLNILHEELDGLNIAEWNNPKGGYFISFNVKTGSARAVGDMCKQAGITLTNVGATYPYGIDPNDKNIRLAPSCPSVDELRLATRVLCVALKLSATAAIKVDRASI